MKDEVFNPEQPAGGGAPPDRAPPDRAPPDHAPPDHAPKDDAPTGDTPIAAPPARARKRPRGLLAPLAGTLGWTFVALFYGSILWALAYRFVPPPGTYTMLERKLSGETINHPWTPLSEISPHLVRAVIAAEDSRFCMHTGLDFAAIDDALDEKKNGGKKKRQRGASTVTQQTAKNAFLWNGGGWLRKGAEAWMSLVIETLWPKRRIMEVYLNIAEWGDGHFGAEAAARARFEKSAADLTKQEAALLASVLPSPNKWRVDPPGPYVKSRAATLRKRMDVVRSEGLDRCVLDQNRT
jgi:monofunctional biosynthetic peptidoglycan transglycosylase